MVIVLEKGIPEAEKNELRKFLEINHFRVNEINGEEETIFGAVGQLSIDPREVEILPGVARVIPISKPYKMASREFKKENSIVEIKNNRGQIIRVGGSRLVSIAGPCAVENKEQMMEIARRVASAGAVMLRGGAYKPRTSPYAFQGMAEEGLKLLKDAGNAYGLPVVTEIVSADHIPHMIEYDIDVLQIGARNMQNFELLKKVGAMARPVILKRGISATIEEWLMAAEYLLSSGANDVILCERGIRTYEKATRNTLDLSAIPILRSLTHLPIIVDPSHAVGIRDKVSPMGLAAVAAGADGIIVEVHNCPDKAMSDGAQSLYPDQFEKLMRDIDVMCPVVGKEMTRIRSDKTGVKAAVKNVNSSCCDQTSNKTDNSSTNITCAYSGSRGAYAEQAIEHYFDNTATALPVNNFREVFQAVLEGKVQYGMLPIENSLAGSVYENYDNLCRFEDVDIVGAIKLRIEHALLAKGATSIDSIKTVYSHPQGFAQCREFLNQHPEWKLVECSSTSTAALTVAEKSTNDCAAIASVNAAASAKLEVLKTGIETDPRNYTRFLLITAKDDVANSDEANMATVSFTVRDESGRLYDCLGVFRNSGLNLTRLESRPIQGKPWQYMFYADVALTSSTIPVLPSAIEELKKYAEEVRLLGAYLEIN